MVQPRVLVEQEQLALPRGGPDLARPHPRLQPEVLRPPAALLLQAVQVGLVQGGHAAAGPLGLPLGAARRRHDEPVLGTPRLIHGHCLLLLDAGAAAGLDTKTALAAGY